MNIFFFKLLINSNIFNNIINLFKSFKNNDLFISIIKNNLNKLLIKLYKFI